MEERRKYVRVPTNSIVHYEIIPYDKKNDGVSKNISRGGIKFLAPEFIPKNSRLKIKIIFENTFFTIEALTRLVWIREVPSLKKYEVGVEFIDLPLDAAEYLMHSIRAISVDE